jgi:predicted Zn-ribbon and HTH transcriptional regulator
MSRSNARTGHEPASCNACGARLPGDSEAHDSRCPDCRQPVADGDFPAQARRIAGVVMGALVQLASGGLYLLHPPGSSTGAWALYIVLGFAGFLWMFISARAWRSAAIGERTVAVTASFESGDIPYHAKSCRHCGQSLERAVAAGRRRCPHCDTHFSLRDLGWRQVDHAGEPATLAPNERRLPGTIVAAVLFVALLAVILVVTLVGSSATAPLGP